MICLRTSFKDEFVVGTVEAYAIDGKTYALPIELNIVPVYYNKALFEQFNLEVPETYDEFRHIVDTLAANGIAPIALGTVTAGPDRSGHVSRRPHRR